MKSINNLPAIYRKSGLTGLIQHAILSPLDWGSNHLRHAIKVTQRRVQEVNVRGIKRPVYIRPATTDMAVLREVLWEDEYACELPEEPKVIVDAGANIGLTSVFYANRYPNALIVALEPEITNYKLLLKNTEPYPNIRPMKLALWSEPKMLNLHADGCHAGYYVRDEGGADTAAVSVEYLVSMLPGVQKIDLLKMDIECAERQVLEAYQKWIHLVRVLVVGTHDYINPTKPPYCKMALMKAISGRIEHFEKKDGIDGTTVVWLKPLLATSAFTPSGPDGGK